LKKSRSSIIVSFERLEADYGLEWGSIQAIEANHRYGSITIVYAEFVEGAEVDELEVIPVRKIITQEQA
jgi:hypothetical protein